MNENYYEGMSEAVFVSYILHFLLFKVAKVILLVGF